MATRLTKKQKGFVKDYIQTGNGVKSALNNYDTEDYNTANQIAIENLQRPIIQKAIESLADQIPDEDLIKVHKEGLNAGKTIFKNNNSTGEIEEVGYEPDYATRYKYLDSAYKLKGSYAAEKSVALNVTMDGQKVGNVDTDAIREEFENKLRGSLTK